jgi:glycosyltransferase involved in cell wall biosynthesis
MSKVSIIMPTYNRAWILGRAVESVLTQTFKDFELIIVNDGSADDTQKVLKDFSDARITVINLETNGGLSHARNTGLKKATGEFIAYLDSDNLWYPEYLEATMEAFDDKTIMVYSGQNLLLVGGTKEHPEIIGRKTRNEKYNPVKLTQGNYIDVNCVVHRRSLIKEVGLFDEDLKVLEDWDLFVQIAIKYPFGIKHLDQVLSEYYFYLPETETTLSNQKWQDWILEEFHMEKAEGDKLAVNSKIKNLLGEK